MTRQYDTPQAFKDAVEHRLKAAAAEKGVDIQRLRQLFVFDRLLARIFTHFEDVLLKGGFVVELRTQRARTTKDLDFRLTGEPDRILAELQKAGRLGSGDYLTFEVRPDTKMHTINADALEYEGRRYRAKAQLAGKVYGAPFGIDVVFAEPLVGTPEVVQGSSFLQFAGIEPVDYQIYPLLAHVAEKLHAYTLPRSQTNSRVKDLPDIGLLASSRPISADRLREALRATFNNRGTHELPAQVPVPPASWAPVYERMAEKDALPWDSLAEALSAVKDFLDPVLGSEGGIWDPEIWSWEVGDETQDATGET